MNKKSRDVINVYNSRQIKRLDYMEDKDEYTVLDYVFRYITLEAIEKALEYFGKFKVVYSPFPFDEKEKSIISPEEMMKDKSWIHYFGKADYCQNWSQLCMIATIIREEIGIDFEPFEDERKMEVQMRIKKAVEVQRLQGLSDKEFKKEKGMTKEEWAESHPEFELSPLTKEDLELFEWESDFLGFEDVLTEPDEKDEEDKKPKKPKKLN